MSKRLIPLAATALGLLCLSRGPAAPKLPPAFEFISHHAEGGHGPIKDWGQKITGITFRADFTVRGPAGKCVVELWMEAGTGEKVKLIDRLEIEIPASGRASGKFDRNELEVHPGEERDDKQPLPLPIGYYWSYRLILKRDKGDPVADTGVEMVLLPGDR